VTALQTISTLLAAYRGGAHSFVKKLDEGGHRHLSFSKVVCVESCPYAYYLQYVERVRLVPELNYFVKGRVFHRAAARFYRRRARGEQPAAGDLAPITRRRDDSEARLHLANAAALLVSNAFHEWEVCGVEEIFVLDLGPSLPPCVGVIDLILRKGPVYAVVDHKTGKALWPQDPMQLAIYREHVLRSHGAVRCRGFYDSYRWVNNLNRIRKPAFERTAVRFHPRAFAQALARFERGYATMCAIEKTGDAPGAGSCWMCAYRPVCTKAAVATSWW
jgi:hypothetical protein